MSDEQEGRRVTWTQQASVGLSGPSPITHHPSLFEVTLDNGVLTLSGQRATEKTVGKDERGLQMRIERGSGQFHRRFILPDSIDSEQINARGRNGVIEISIRKQAKAQPRRIKVAA